MPVVLTKSGAVFLHCHKTGGTWVKSALAAAGIGYEHRGYDHWDYCASLYISLGGRRFTTVRNPYRWYALFWAYRQQYGWGGDLSLGLLEEGNFHRFVQRSCDECPGFLTELYGRYCPNESVWVLKTINLRQNLIDVLLRLGEEFDPEVLRTIPPANQSAALSQFSSQVVYDESTADCLFQSERAVFERFNYDRQSWRN